MPYIVNTNNNPIFISIETTAFSGATLLSFLLGSHPQIATVGEMDGLLTRQSPDEYLCSCGQKIKQCEFWQSIKVAMADRGFEFDVADFKTRFILNGPDYLQRLREGTTGNSLESIRDAILFALPNETHQLKRLVNRNVALVESVLAVTNKNVFLDSSKDRLRIKALHRFSRSMDTRAIHLVRDVRGVIASRVRRSKKPRDMAKLAQKWVKHHRGLEIALKAWPSEKHIRVRYEDLCQNTKCTLKQLYDFCGVDSSLRLEEFRTDSQHILGNKMRLKPLSEIKLDERWKEELTAEQLKIIDCVAGALSRQYGYS